MYKLLSERMNPKPLPNTVTLDQAPKKFRNQMLHAVHDTFNDRLFYNSSDIASTIIQEYAYLKGEPPLDIFRINCVVILESILVDIPPKDLFDYIDIMGKVFFQDVSSKHYYNTFEERVNDILRSNSIGYKLIDGIMIPFTEKYEADELIDPAFRLLTKYGLNIASTYLSDSFSHLRDGKYEEAISAAFKAFESVLESVLIKCKIEFNKGDTTSKKIDLLTNNQLCPLYLKSSISSLNNLLKAPNSVRNNESGHGSSTTKNVDVNLVQLEIDMIASIILFLVRTNYGQKN